MLKSGEEYRLYMSEYLLILASHPEYLKDRKYLEPIYRDIFQNGPAFRYARLLKLSGVRSELFNWASE